MYSTATRSRGDVFLPRLDRDLAPGRPVVLGQYFGPSLAVHGGQLPESRDNRELNLELNYQILNTSQVVGK